MTQKENEIEEENTATASPGDSADTSVEVNLEDSNAESDGEKVETDTSGENSRESDENAAGEPDDDAMDDDDEETPGDEEVDLEKKYKAVNDKYLRLYAEFENFRRRSAKESIETYQNAGAKIIEKLLPTLQDFERAYDPEKKAANLEDFEAGIKMIFNNFKDVLEEAGLEEINPEGEEFDPQIHDALMQQHHDTVEEDHIISVFEKGYKVNSKIIKHAKVITSKGKEE